MKFIVEIDTGGGKYIASQYFDSEEDARSFVLGIVPEEWWIYATIRTISQNTTMWYDNAKAVSAFVWQEHHWSQVHDL